MSKLRNKTLQPTIINKDSNFVVITYWWGRGNKNKNTQRPCPEDLQENQRLTRKPITFDKMINEWKKSCRRANCNYMVVEYPEFAKKGMYQKAINFKPLFIQDALKACYPRAVLYIDGDMHIKRYPRIFDIPNVDYMAQGWNSDPRYKMIWEDNAKCYYPYVFETSGGTMYFNNTRQSKMLLREWYKSVRQYPLKAEDRLISQIFNNQRMLLPMNTIQLPIEYLWLSIDYNTLPKDVWTYSRVMITHPECLTGEDRAFAEGAALERFPPRYASQITDQIQCRMRNMPFYEYIFFPTKADVSSMRDWIDTMNEMGLIETIGYNDKYGKYNTIYQKNIELLKDIKIYKRQGLVHITAKDSALTDLHNAHHLEKASDLIPTILKYLLRGNNVVYIPSSATPSMVSRVKSLALQSNATLLCRNSNNSVQHYKKEYTLVVDQNYPLYLRANSTVLKHLLYMSKTMTQLCKHFSKSFIFPSRIRCKWV